MDKVKEPTTYTQQVEKLKSRGCIISDESKSIDFLSSVGYYRLSAYFLPFKKADDAYMPGTTLERIYHIYEFDSRLRRILFSAIESIEINLRSMISYHYSLKYGSLGYYDKQNFNHDHNPKRFKENVEREIKSNRNQPFVKHHIEKYNCKFPLWAVMELFTFGMLSYFYSDMKTEDQKALFGKKYKKVRSWLHCCTDLRNMCAHYNRLYYRKFTSIPAGIDVEDNRSLWAQMLVVKELYPSNKNWNTDILPALRKLFDDYHDSIDLKHISFPENWYELLKN